MAITKREETVQEDSQSKNAIIFTFTNGAKQQLEDLQKHFNTSSSLELIKLAVSILQKLKEYDEKNKKINDKDK